MQSSIHDQLWSLHINRYPGVAITPAVCSVTNFFTICKYWPGSRVAKKVWLRSMMPKSRYHFITNVTDPSKATHTHNLPYVRVSRHKRSWAIFKNDLPGNSWHNWNFIRFLQWRLLSTWAKILRLSSEKMPYKLCIIVDILPFWIHFIVVNAWKGVTISRWC